MPVPPKSSIEEQQQIIAEAKKQCDYYSRFLGGLYKSLSEERPMLECIMNSVKGTRYRMVSSMSFVDTIDVDGKYHKKELCNGTSQT